MRSLVILALGALAGAVAVIMLQTLDSDGTSPPPEPSGGGNARMSFDEGALVALLARDLEDQLPPGAISVSVEARGVVVVSIRGIAPPESISGDITLDPDLDEGQLVLSIVDVDGAIPPMLVENLQAALRNRLQTLAGAANYRVTAITTANHRLEIEIKI
jgi:hypothetical protein